MVKRKRCIRAVSPSAIKQAEVRDEGTKDKQAHLAGREQLTTFVYHLPAGSYLAAAGAFRVRFEHSAAVALQILSRAPGDPRSRSATPDAARSPVQACRT